MTNAISADGLALIKQYEGFRAEPAPLPDGTWIVGHGHVRVGDAGGPVSETEAEDLLARDLAPIERVVNAQVSQTLTPSQFDALVSFVFSIGAEAFARSQVLRRTNAGDFIAAALAMDAWRKSDAGGELITVGALVRRRTAEKALYLKELAHEPAPSALVRAKLDYAASVLGAPIEYKPAPAPVARAEEPVCVPVAAEHAPIEYAPQVSQPEFQSGASEEAQAEQVSAPDAPLAAHADIECAASEDAPVACEPAHETESWTLQKTEPGAVLTEILKSEPATEALLLTQVAPHADAFEDEGEIVTAHAKPVARPLDNVREAMRRAYLAREESLMKSSLVRRLREKYETMTKGRQADVTADRRIRSMRDAPERRLGDLELNPDVIAPVGLLILGLALVGLGVSLVLEPEPDMVEMLSAAAVATPGVAACLMGAISLTRIKSFFIV